MDKIFGSLTVFFDELFWVGVFERQSEGKLQVVRIVFGSEPKDGEIYEYLLKYYDQLNFSIPMTEVVEGKKKVNPKRMHRDIKKQLLQKGIGTKAQQALKIEQENNKYCRKNLKRQKSEEEKQHQFELRQEKKKEKHRGR